MTQSTPLRRRFRRPLTIALAMASGVAVVTAAVHPSLLDIFSAAPTETSPSVAVVHDGNNTPDDASAAPGLRYVTVLPPDGARYFGVSVPEVVSGADPSPEFTKAVGVAPTMQMFFQSFTDTFDLTTARRITAAGRLPMVTWEPYDWRSPSADAFPLNEITAGRYDDYLRAQANQFASIQGPLVIRFGHEMNGDWYPWAAKFPGNAPADFIAAYRHVHEVVTRAGATNAVWMWAPNLVDADPEIGLASVYPGDDVVDWVGLSGYFTKEDDTFTRRFGPTLSQLDVVAPSKPILLAETAVPQLSSRPALIAELVAGIRRSPRFIGLVWFDHHKRADWTVDDDSAAAAALGAAIRSGGFGATPQPAGGG